jgi:hypothetical protein
VTAGTVTGAVGTLNILENASSFEVGNNCFSCELAGTYTLTVSDDCSSKSNGYCRSAAAALALATSTKTDASCFELARVLWTVVSCRYN